MVSYLIGYIGGDLRKNFTKRRIRASRTILGPIACGAFASTSLDDNSFEPRFEQFVARMRAVCLPSFTYEDTDSRLLTPCLGVSVADLRKHAKFSQASFLLGLTLFLFRFRPIGISCSFREGPILNSVVPFCCSGELRNVSAFAALGPLELGEYYGDTNDPFSVLSWDDSS